MRISDWSSDVCSSDLHLRDAAALLAADNPALEVHAVCADFTKPFRVPRPQNVPWARRIGFFPGSTLGNFTHRQARDFLAGAEIGRAHVRTPVTNAHLVCRLLLDNK